MKSFTIICLVGLFAVALSRPSNTYTDKYDSLNIDEILENRRLLVPYLKCVLDQGKCAPEGKELKEHMVDSLETNCAKCTEVQRVSTRKIIKHLINNEPDFWTQIANKYDPAKKYVTRYEKEYKEPKA